MTLKEELIQINKNFSDGTLRYDGEFERLETLAPLEIAIEIAKNHYFTDGNKRTAIRFMEQKMHEEVPWFVYRILKES